MQSFSLTGQQRITIRIPATLQDQYDITSSENMSDMSVSPSMAREVIEAIHKPHPRQKMVSSNHVNHINFTRNQFCINVNRF
jgi:hypothetical protein